MTGGCSTGMTSPPCRQSKCCVRQSSSGVSSAATRVLLLVSATREGGLKVWPSSKQNYWTSI